MPDPRSPESWLLLDKSCCGASAPSGMTGDALLAPTSPTSEGSNPELLDEANNDATNAMEATSLTHEHELILTLLG